MSKKTIKKIKSLNSEIQLIQTEKFLNDFDNAIKKDFKNQLKKVILSIIPLILAIIGYLILKTPTLLTIGTSITSISLIKNLIKTPKKANTNNNKFKSNIININQEKNPEQILQEGIGKIKAEDFYSEKYKSMLKQKDAYLKNENQGNYREPQKKHHQQPITKNNPNLKIIDTNTNYLTKDETMMQIVKEIDVYTIAYNLPPLKISNYQWDLFFDTTYNFFNHKELEPKFYDSISQIERFVFAKSLLNKKNKISIYDFIENLYYLENESIEKKEILILQQEILSKLPSTQIINLSDYTLRKKKRK